MTEQPQQPYVPHLMDDEQRAKLLSQAVGGDVAGGGRVESHTPHAAVLVYGQKVNHVLHAIITFFTCGLWGFVWLVLGLSNGEKRHALTVDPYGHVTRRKL